MVGSELTYVSMTRTTTVDPESGIPSGGAALPRGGMLGSIAGCFHGSAPLAMHVRGLILDLGCGSSFLRP